MILIGIADLHGNVSALAFLGPKIAAADLVLLVGDLTNFGREDDAAAVIEAVEQYNPNLLAVPGNCDYPAVGHFLSDRGVSLDRCGVVRDGVGFIGVGASLPTPSGSTPNEMPDEQLDAALRHAAAQVRGGPTVLVSHEPPFNTLADRVSSGAHVGSHSVRAFIEQRRPLVCFCGHIHEGVGVDDVHGCKVVNPGPAHQGRYARVVLAKGPSGTIVESCETRSA